MMTTYLQSLCHTIYLFFWNYQKILLPIDINVNFKITSGNGRTTYQFLVILLQNKLQLTHHIESKAVEPPHRQQTQMKIQRKPGRNDQAIN